MFDFFYPKSVFQNRLGELLLVTGSDEVDEFIYAMFHHYYNDDVWSYVGEL